MSMAVIVPSRGRPQNVEALIEAWGDTWDGNNTTATLIVAIDTDDPEFENYPHPGNVPSWVKVHHGPRRRLGGTLNHLAPFTAERYDVVGFMGDDHRPRTGGWDFDIERAMVPGGVVYGNDLIHGSNLPTAVFMDSRIVRTLGWFVIPGMTHLFMDNLWKTLGEQLGTLRYLPDVIIEHVHPIAGKAEWDAGYVECNTPDIWQHDEALYREWVAFQMPADIAKIRAAL
jgi:hypothetical protein